MLVYVNIERFIRKNVVCFKYFIKNKECDYTSCPIIHKGLCVSDGTHVLNTHSKIDPGSQNHKKNAGVDHN